MRSGSSLNICTWNVGGLISEQYNKLQDPNFIKEIDNFDIVLLTETHLGYETHVSIDKFIYYPFCRTKSKNNRYFGGLGVLIKADVKKGIKFMNDGTSEYQWIKLGKDFFNFKRDIYLCLIYYAPKNLNNLLETIEYDITEKYSKKGDILLAGDFNSRTGTGLDFIINDDTAHIPINETDYNVDTTTQGRVSQDCVIDTRGKELLELCICNQLRILNGRFIGNSNGKFTCYKPNGCSIVDYFILSESLLPQVLYVHVSDFKAAFSDCHSKVSMKLMANFEREANFDNLIDFPARFIWNNESIQTFQETFAHPATQNDIKKFMDEKISLHKVSIDTATNNIHVIFEKVCSVSLKKKKRKKKIINNENKNWFDQELTAVKRQLEDKAYLMSKFPNDPLVRGSFFKMNKKYAKLRKKKKREFKQSILDKLDNLQSENPKEYWSLVNSLRNESRDKPEDSVDGKTWFDYFSKLSSIPCNLEERIRNIENRVKILENNTSSFCPLDFEISMAELLKAIKKLKQGKSPGLDNISNEMLKISQTYINPCLLKLFNAVLRSGHYPEKWSNSYICPIYKSENPKKPENYRGIAINNSIGKLFNIILCNRFDKYLSDNQIIHESQIGFSKNSRTSDHIFVLKCIVDKYLKMGNKRLYAGFVDFRKAFDKVIHTGIMLKLLQRNVNGNFYQILKSMYKNDRLCVKIGCKMTDFFPSEVGVRQGDVLSPNLFKYFINDLPGILLKKSDTISLNDKQIPCLLYADDLVLVADSKEKLQIKLDILQTYCEEWCLDINTDKTKIIIFNNTGKLLKEDFVIGNHKIECVKHYKYLGVMISNTGKYTEAKKKLYDKALKASFKLYRDVKATSPSIKSLLHIFDHTIKPIVLYGSENWGMINLTNKRKLSSLFEIYKEWDHEKLNIKFSKFILGVSKQSTNIAVLSELGRYPLYCDIILQMLMYWHRLENSSSELLKSAYNEYKSNPKLKDNTWYANIIFLAEKLDIDLSICKGYSKWKLKKLLKKRIRENFLKNWELLKKSYDQEHGKLNTYFSFKSTFEYESHLSIKNRDNRNILTKFRISNHTLRIEMGRQERKMNDMGKQEILPRGERVCQKCSSGNVEDEIHFMLVCHEYNRNRNIFFEQIFGIYPNLRKLNPKSLFLWIMANEDIKFLNSLAEFLQAMFTIRKSK